MTKLSIETFEKKVTENLEMMKMNLSYAPANDAEADAMKTRVDTAETMLKTLVERMETNQNETIADGLILEFSDLLDHFADESIWNRYIGSLSFLLRNDPYYLDALAPINVLQQCNTEVHPDLPAAMAVSLIDPINLMSTKPPKIRSKADPYLIVNPVQLFLSTALGIDDFTLEDSTFYHRVNGILIHESMHISRGDLLLDIRYHYSSPMKAEEYQKAMRYKPIEMKRYATQEIYTPVGDIYLMNNILSDLSINTAVKGIDTQLLSDIAYEKHLVSKHTIGGTVDNAIQQVDIQSDEYETPADFELHSIDDFISDETLVRNKQYALLEYHMATLTEDEKEEMEKMPKESEANGPLGESDILRKHKEAQAEMDEDEKADVVAKADNQINVANQEAADETSGRGVSIRPSSTLREKIIELKKAKSLPRFDAKVKGLIRGRQNEKTVNYSRRHIAYPSRLDLGHRQKLNKEKETGMYVYFDVSGSVGNKMIDNIFSILMETVKTEPVKLFVFSDGITHEPLDITRKTKVDDVKWYIQDADTGLGTRLTPVFEKIIEKRNYKHAIISDYLFEYYEFERVQEALKGIFIIHCLQPQCGWTLEQFKETPVYAFIMKYPKLNKLLNIDHYTL